MGTTITTPQKSALPIDFTKVIECKRWNLLPKINAPVSYDRFDIEIDNNVQIPSTSELNQINNINIDTSNINTAPVIPNFGNISVTNVLPANAKVICNLIPVVNNNIPGRNIKDNNATGNATAKIAPTIGKATLNNEVSGNTTCNTDSSNAIVDNNKGYITVAEILPTGNSQVDNIENNANNTLNVLDNNLVSVVQTNDSVVKEIGSTGLNQVEADARNAKLLATVTQTVSDVPTEILAKIKETIGNTGPMMIPTGRICTQNVSENAQILNTNDSNQQKTSVVSPNMYTIIRTSAGSYLIPLSVIQKTNTVNSVTAPTISTGVTTENTIKVTALNKNASEAKKHSAPRNKNDYLIPDDTHKELKDHCKCCIVLRKICKDKQTCITDFFTSNKNIQKSCECTNRKYPNTTKRLKLFLKNYKSNSWCVHKELQSKLKLIRKEMHEGQACGCKIESLQDEYSLEDIGK